MHVKIPIQPQPAAENHLFFLRGSGAVFLIDGIVFLVVQRIIRFIPMAPDMGILFCHYGPGIHGIALALIFKVLMFDNPGIRHLVFGIIHHRIALIVFHIQNLRLKPQTAILQFPVTVIIPGIDHPRIDNPLGKRGQRLPLLQKIRLQPDFQPVQHLFNNPGITADRYALIGIVKIIIVIDKPHRQTPDNKCRQLRGPFSPLLFRISPDELFINIPSDQTNRLLFQVARRFDTRFPCFAASCAKTLPNSPAPTTRKSYVIAISSLSCSVLRCPALYPDPYTAHT